MRAPEERMLALECLRLAHGNIVEAGKMLAFVTGDGDKQASVALDRAWETVEGFTAAATPQRPG